MPSPEKGKQITFIDGRYRGKKGWMDKTKQSKDKSQVYVIVPKEENGIIREVQTRVKMSSISSIGEPSCLLEGLLKEFEDMEASLTKLCHLLVKCGVNFKGQQDQNLRDFNKILLSKMKQEQALMDAKGNKAEYRIVHWVLKNQKNKRWYKSQDDMDSMDSMGSIVSA
jgi:hypothetical protein